MAAKRSRGGVKFPTGGDGSNASARERTTISLSAKQIATVVVSRFGVIPKPTVMFEQRTRSQTESPDKRERGSTVAFRGGPCALILVTTWR